MSSYGIFESSENSTGVDERSKHEKDSHEVIVVCVCENRSREVCIVAMRSSELEVYVFADSHRYVETMSTLQTIDPDEILLHDGSRSSLLTKKIESLKAEYDIRVVYMSRAYFDQDRGSHELGKLIVGSVDADLASKYTVLASCYCLLRYLTNITGQDFAERSLRLSFHGGSADRMAIDRRSCVALELISCLLDGNQKQSLFGYLNHTHTKVGARLLRANILRPLVEIPTLRTRQAVVEVLLKDHASREKCAASLKFMPDIDFVLHELSKVPKNISDRVVSMGVTTMLMLHEILITAGNLGEVLEDLQETAAKGASTECNDESPHIEALQLFKALSDTLKPLGRNEGELMAAIESTIDRGAVRACKNKSDSACFSLREGVSGPLDIARANLIDTIQQISNAADVYAEELSCSVKVQHTANRGYYLHVDCDTKLPSHFIQVVKARSVLSCTTAHIAALSQRAKEGKAVVLRLTYEALFNLFVLARSHIDSILALADGCALLDVLQSFADKIAANIGGFVKPTFHNHREISLLGARHPIISESSSFPGTGTGFVSNDFRTDADTNFILVTGPNGSGKSVFIKQVAICVIMAQIGMFVSADVAELPLIDRIVARMGCSDDFQYNVSTFKSEMKELAYLTCNVTPRSLVLVDELGKGTSHVDGISLAFSAAEWLIASSAITLFITHFPQLALLPKMYPHTKSVHMQTAEKSGIHFLHQLGEGASGWQIGYGIAMARICGFPVELVRQAEKLQPIIRQRYPILLSTTQADTSAIAVSQLLQHLLLLGVSSMDNAALRQALVALQARVPASALHTLRELLQLASNESIKSDTHIVSPDKHAKRPVTCGASSGSTPPAKKRQTD